MLEGKRCFAGAAVLLMATLPTVLGCGSRPSSPAPASKPAGPAGGQQQEDLQNAEPDATVSAEQLYDEFSKKNDEAVARYGGKVVEVTGAFADYLFDPSGNLAIRLAGSKGEPVRFQFRCKDKQLFNKALPGQAVTLRSRGKSGIGLVSWELVKVTGDRPPTFTADELVKQAKSDKEGTSKKLKGKFAVVTGTVTKVEGDGYHLTLTPPDKEPEVMCSYDPNSPAVAEGAKRHKVGDKVKVLGQSDDGSLHFQRCVDFGSASDEKGA